MSKVFTKKEVDEHKSEKDLYLIVKDNVYDVTSFIQEHPGGEEVLLELGGQDATEAYMDIGHSESADKLLESFKIGTLDVSSEDVKKETKTQIKPPSSSSSGSGIVPILIPVVVAIIFFIYKNYLS